VLCTSRWRSLPWISRTHSLEVTSISQGEAESIFRIYLDDETVEKHRDALLEFAERMERLPIAIVVGADILRNVLDPVAETACGLRFAITAGPSSSGGCSMRWPSVRSRDSEHAARERDKARAELEKPKAADRAT
jgi:hypothetical protein